MAPSNRSTGSRATGDRASGATRDAERRHGSFDACTIVSKNYIAYARVLARSFREHHRGSRIFVLLVDRNDGKIDPADEPFELLEAEDLSTLPDARSFLFKYTLLEANTAVKPYFLEHLFAHQGVDRLAYFDPDILITRPMQPLEALLDEHEIVLTPHLDTPIEDDAHPDELAILQAGTYNLGFVALRRGPVAERLLRWWQARLFDRCVVDIGQGLFVDQKWMDLVPGLFGDTVRIMRHPGWNVAYWNLHGRTVTIEDDGPRANGEPLFFFHFSGIDPEHLRPVSKHQDRFTLSDLGGAADLYHHYAGRVRAEGHDDARGWPYAFACFDHGVRIPDAARVLYRQLGEGRRQRFGDPFQARSAGAGDTAGNRTHGESFFAWLDAPVRAGKQPPYLSRLLERLHRGRPDLVRIFPDPGGRDLENFSSWLEGFGRHELKIDDAFLTHIHRDSKRTRFTVGGMKRRIDNRLKRAYHSSAGISARELLKRTLGHERVANLRNKLRPPIPSAAARIFGRARLAMPAEIARPGINVVGYLDAETGMGQAARGLVRALETTGVPHSLHNLDLGVVARRGDSAFANAVSDFPYDVNVFVVNADQVLPVYEHLGGDVFGDRVNIGFWLWELERFLDRWLPAFDVLHEVWTPSRFCQGAISAVAPLPVRCVPLPVEPPAATPEEEPNDLRARFGLPKDAFLFLYSFNFLSYAERKNPWAAVEAFRRAFDPIDPVALVLKTAQSDFAPEARARIDALIGDANVMVIDQYFDRADTDALMATTDAYVSLHRSEGFGLTVAEAQVIGKPVVATPYGGVTDFFDRNNGFPVKYDLVTLEDDEGPYPAGARWADPDIEDAAQQMRRVVEDPDEVARRTERATRDIADLLSYKTVGTTIQESFDRLIERVGRQQLGRLS